MDRIKAIKRRMTDLGPAEIEQARAAALELLLACEDAEEFLTSLVGTTHEIAYPFFRQMNSITLDKLRAAIAKARGDE